MKTEILKLGKLEINLNDLANFLVEAKKACWAGNGKEEIMPDGSKQLALRYGPLVYTDNYAGYYQFSGVEIVIYHRVNKQKIWQMSYSGGMLPEFQVDEKLAEKTFSFLKEALLQVAPEAPFRGPKAYSNEIGAYINRITGDIKKFKGEEEIRMRREDYKEYCIDDKARYLVYSLNYHGGIIIPK